MNRSPLDQKHRIYLRMFLLNVEFVTCSNCNEAFGNNYSCKDLHRICHQDEAAVIPGTCKCKINKFDLYKLFLIFFKKHKAKNSITKKS